MRVYRIRFRVCFQEHKKRTVLRQSSFLCSYFLSVYKSSDTDDMTITCIVSGADIVLGITCMDDLVMAHIDSNMSAVADQISGFCSTEAGNSLPVMSLGGRGVGQLLSEVAEDSHGKS